MVALIMRYQRRTLRCGVGQAGKRALFTRNHQFDRFCMEPHRADRGEEIVKDQIEAQLRVLVGLPLWDSGRGADMEWFAFGARQTVPQRGGGSREVSEYALHVHCQWRLVSPTGIVTGRQDLYYPAGDPDQEPPDRDWDRQGANRCDERIAAFFAAPATSFLHVEQIWADQPGSRLRAGIDAGELAVA